MKKAKSTIKGIKQNHVANTKYGMGDSYGSGIRNPTGKIDPYKIKTPKIKKPPRSLA